MSDWQQRIPWNIVNDCAVKLSLDSKLLAAIIQKESSGNPWATRFEPRYRWLHFPRTFADQLLCTVETEEVHQKTSFGLMQVMGAVAREMGYRAYLPALCVPEVGVWWGAVYFRTLLQRFSGVNDAVSAYNQGSPRKTNGVTYDNERYVDGVMGYYRQL